MAKTEVLLRGPVSDLGAEGDIVKVAAGYARNYLLPRGIAVLVNRANKKFIEALQKARVLREAKELDEAKVKLEKLKKTSLAFALKTAASGKEDDEVKVFGSVTAADIQKRLAENGVEVERKAVHLVHPLKKLGAHQVVIKLHKDIQFELPVEIVSENPIETESKKK